MSSEKPQKFIYIRDGKPFDTLKGLMKGQSQPGNKGSQQANMVRDKATLMRSRFQEGLLRPFINRRLLNFNNFLGLFNGAEVQAQEEKENLIACPQCKLETQKDTSFCPKCGYNFAYLETDEKKERDRREKLDSYSRMSVEI